MASIAHFVAIRVKVCPELQTEGGRKASDDVDGLRRHIALLDTSDAVGAHSKSSGDLTPADPRGEPRGDKLLGQSLSELSATSLAYSRGREAVRHPALLSRARLTTRLSR